MSYDNLVIALAVAAAVPFLLALAPRVRLPGPVLEIVAGLVLGPAVLDRVRPDGTVEALSVIGLSFLLFLAGLEIDLERWRGRPHGSSPWAWPARSPSPPPSAGRSPSPGWWRARCWSVSPWRPPPSDCSSRSSRTPARPTARPGNSSSGSVRRGVLRGGPLSLFFSLRLTSLAAAASVAASCFLGVF